MKCYNHPETDAVGICTSCRQSYCSACMVEIEGKMICRDCLAKGNVRNVSDEITENDRMMSMLAYLICPVVPLVILFSDSGKNSRFQRYHAIHSLLFVMTISALVLIFGCILSIITLGAASICLLPIEITVWVFAIIFGVKANQGEYLEIPLITDLARSQGWV